MTIDRRAKPRSILVVGGRYSWENGNRLFQMENELPTAPHNDVMQYLREVEAATSVDELGKILLNLAAKGYNLVGSRGYCYSSQMIANEIFNRQDPRLVTRTGNLRMKYVQLALQELENIKDA